MTPSDSPENDPSLNQNRQMHLCPDCSSEFVQPTSWKRINGQTSAQTAWRVSLRCPECEWQDEDVFSEQTIDKFDEKLDDGTYEVARALRRIERENMNDMVGPFITALEADIIGPDDFRPRPNR